MNQASEARHAAAAERELRAIFRRADKKIATTAAKPRVQGTYSAREVMQMLGIRSPQTLYAKVREGVIPPALKPTEPPAGAEPGSAEYRNWYRLHRRWNAKLMFAYVNNILPDETRGFQSPADWRAWLRDHFSHEEFAA